MPIQAGKFPLAGGFGGSVWPIASTSALLISFWLSSTAKPNVAAQPDVAQPGAALMPSVFQGSNQSSVSV
ncbi:MAG TPA: hypothetical protein V6C57_23405 [Coleofasciculaceae cyanobacterium]